MAEQTAINQHYRDLERLLMLDDDDNQDDRLLDLYIDEMQEPPSGSDFSGTHLDENINNQNGSSDIFSDNQSQVPVWPVQPSPQSCTCCQILRQVFHINGTNVLKLELHGKIGIISHAVLEKYNDMSSSQNPEYHMFDFSHESLSNVKQFLIKYIDDCKREGFVMMQDPLFYFYDALCIGLNTVVGLDTDISLQQTSIEDGLYQVDHQEGNVNGDWQTNGLYQVDHQEGNVNGDWQTKRHIASQRARTGKMKLKDLAQYFRFPINEAAKRLNLCSSAIKSICRKEGLMRWPYRKINSIESKISQQKKSLSSNDVSERERALAEINRLQLILTTCYEANWIIDLL